MHLKSRLLLPAAAALLALSPALASAQVASATLREGDPLPAVGPAHFVSSLNNAEVNNAGGFALSVNSSDGSTTLSSVYGSPVAFGTPSILALEGMVGTYLQTAFESFYGFDDVGSVAYSPTCNDTVSGATGLDCVFQDANPLAVEGLPIPSLPGMVWRFASRPKMTAGGTPYWSGGINSSTGTNLGNGFFVSASATPLLKTGDLLPGLANPLSNNASSFDGRLSAQGTHWIQTTETTAATAVNNFIVIDGAVATTAVDLIGEDRLIGPKNGGLPLEVWDNFDELGITESGESMFYGDTDKAGTTTDEFIARNGVIIYRELDFIDGEQLVGAIESGYMNEAGDIVAIWDVEGGSADPEALLFNDKILLKEGDLVDLDGDGTPEPNSVLRDFTGLSNVGVGVDRRVWFTADIDVNGTSSTTDDIEGWFSIQDPCGPVRRYGAGCAGTGGFVPRLELAGCASPGGNVSLNVSNGLGGSTAFLFLGLGRGATDLGSNCVLNLTGVSNLVLNVPLGGAGPGAGSISAPILLPPSLPQVTFTMQAFVADPATGIGGAGTAGLEVTIQ